MKVYKYEKANNVIIAEISKKEIYKIDFVTCREPKETLSAFYQRQNTKPALVVNGGFFNMSTGSPVFNFVDEGESKSYNNRYQWGMGVVNDADLEYSCKSSRIWRDFISGYPNLIDGGKKLKIDFAKELDYQARRTALGYNKDYIFIVCVDSPGMNFSQLQDVLLDIGCEYAINLDGGGSTNMLYGGKQMTSTSYNRAVDNVLAIYSTVNINNNTDTSSDKTTTSDAPVKIKYINGFLTPDKQKTITVAGKTLTINQKICPDNLVSDRYIAQWVPAGGHMKPCAKVSNGTGIPRGITAHNTPEVKASAKTTMAEQSVRAFYNGNGGGAVVHYMLDDTSIWQVLETDPGNVERGWHASDMSNRRSAHAGSKYDTIGGNLDTIAIECIGNSAVAEDNMARLIAWLCKEHNLDPKIDLYTHNYFMRLPDKIVIGARKNCPAYILPHWDTFKNKVISYYNSLTGKNTNQTSADSKTDNSMATTTSPVTKYYKVMIDGYFGSYAEALSYKHKIDKKFYMNSLIRNINKKYYIQCVTYTKYESAKALVDRMESSGYPATIA